MKAKINKVTVRIVHETPLALPSAALVRDAGVELELSTDEVALYGLDVQRELVEIGTCAVGSAVITSGGRLAPRRIIHAVGPRWGEGSERGKLASVTFECLRLAESHRLKSIAFPALSTGAMGYPLENCATTMLSQIIDFTFEELKALRTVYLAPSTAVGHEIFKREFAAQIEALKQAGEGKVQV